MPRLPKDKQTNLLQIQKARSIISRQLLSGSIEEEDILYVLKKDVNFILTNNKGNKLKILRGIYSCPFLLCDQPSLSLDFKKILPVILKSRYDSEQNELKYLYENGYLTENELNKELDLLKFNYYNSSQEGKEIEKFGHVKSVIDNRIHKL